MKEITNIHPMSAAKISAAIFSVVGVLLSVVMYVTYLASMYLASPKGAGGKPAIPEETLASSQFSVVILIYTFVLYALAGFFMGYVGAVVYNILAPRIGGVRISFKVK